MMTISAKRGECRLKRELFKFITVCFSPMEVPPTNIRTRSSSDATQPPSNNREETPSHPTPTPVQHSSPPSSPLDNDHVVRIDVIREEPG